MPNKRPSMQRLPRTGKCQVCGFGSPLARFWFSKDSTACELHHIIPHRKGGGEGPENLIELCPNCHWIADNIERAASLGIDVDATRGLGKIVNRGAASLSCESREELVAAIIEIGRFMEASEATQRQLCEDAERTIANHIGAHMAKLLDLGNARTKQPSAAL